jgi:hypothetical protein
MKPVHNLFVGYIISENKECYKTCQGFQLREHYTPEFEPDFPQFLNTAIVLKSTIKEIKELGTIENEHMAPITV